MTSLRFFLLLCLVAGLFGCEEKRLSQNRFCLLAGTVDQVVNTNGSTADQIRRGFTYASGQLTSFTETTPDGTSGFRMEYDNGRITRATSDGLSVVFDYNNVSGKAFRATSLRNGQPQSVFDLEYVPSGRLSRIIETRTVLPAGSTVTSRTFSFTYDDLGNATVERALFVSRNGSRQELETVYRLEDKRSPYANFAEPTLLTVLTLSLPSETLPSRFWQVNTPAKYDTYLLDGTGSRTLRNTVSVTSQQDADGRVTAHELTNTLSLISLPNPITVRSRQTFTYQCSE